MFSNVLDHSCELRGVVHLVLRQTVDREQVVGDQADPDCLLVGQAELVVGVELAVESAQVVQRVVLVVWLG